MNKRFIITLLSVCCILTGLAVTKTDTIRSQTMRDDMLEVTYDLKYVDGQVIVDFMNARAILKGRNRQYNNVKVLFSEGPNVNLPAREVVIKSELKDKGKRLEPFTISDGVDYIHQATTNSDELFIINDSGNKPSLTFEVKGNRKYLEVPVYLSEYKHQNAMGVGKLKLKKQKTTYEIFDQYGPLKINLSEAVSLKPAPAQNATAQATPQTTSQTTVQESVEVIGGGSNSGNVGGSDFELPDMSQVGGGGGAGGGGGDQASEDQQQDDAMQQQADAAAQQANEQAEKDRNQHWWMFIIAAVLGVLGFGGSQVAQHVRNNRNQRNMMDLQNNVVQRAENEAKRRAQSYARNKSHQVVSKARTKGRQAVRSNVSKLGDSVKGKRIGTDETTRQSAANGTNNQSATGSSRRTFGKKNNRNGEISI